MSKRKLMLEEQLIVDAYKKGATLQQLADFHDVSLNTIRRILIMRGVERRWAGRPRKGK